MPSESLSYFLKSAWMSSVLCRATARVRRSSFVLATFSTVAPDSRLHEPIRWSSCERATLVSWSLPSSDCSSGILAGASFMAAWCWRKCSEAVVARASASAPEALMPSTVPSICSTLSSASALKAAARSRRLSSPPSAASTSLRSSLMSSQPCASCSRFLLASSKAFSSSFRFCSVTASTRFWTCATTFSHSSLSSCCLSPRFGNSFSNTCSSSFFTSSKFSTLASLTFCCAFLISVIDFSSCARFSWVSRLTFSSSSFFCLASSSLFFCSSTFLFVSASISSFRLRFISSSFFLFSSILSLASSCFFRASSMRCCGVTPGGRACGACW
mmetsp:Transcript_90685/g.256782  ORF Transcript_90685/g.256782 Transcript_90685/m.256782 type:complete len:329 (-) Transcript_90685:67-1053(-)